MATIPTTLTVTGTQTTAPTGSCSRVNVNVTGNVTGTTDDGGGLDQITIELWDDGSNRATATTSVPVGTTQSINVTLGFDGAYGVGAAGIGVLVIDGGSTIFSIDPFVPTDVVGSCGTQAIPVMSLPMLFGTGAGLTLAGMFGLRNRRRKS